MSEKTADATSQPRLTDAAAKTATIMQALRTRLNRETGARDEAEHLDRELREYFAASPPASPVDVPVNIRNEVIEAVVERVLVSWRDPTAGLADLKREVIERLAGKILAELKGKG